MNLSDQVNKVGNGFDASNHTFFKAIANAVQAEIEKNTGLKLVLQGKTSSKGSITAILAGQSVDPKQIDGLDDKVRQTMDNLRNPSNLISALKK